MLVSDGQHFSLRKSIKPNGVKSVFSDKGRLISKAPNKWTLSWNNLIDQ